MAFQIQHFWLDTYWLIQLSFVSLHTVDSLILFNLCLITVKWKRKEKTPALLVAYVKVWLNKFTWHSYGTVKDYQIKPRRYKGGRLPVKGSW